MILYQNSSRMRTATQKREVGRFSRNRVVLVFDPKDGWLVVGTWLLNGWKMVVEHFAVVESWLEGGMNDGQDKDG